MSIIKYDGIARDPTCYAIWDDFDDNRLCRDALSRTLAAVGGEGSMKCSPPEAQVWRPEWKIVNGSATISGGTLNTPAAQRNTISTSLPFVPEGWEWRSKADSVGSAVSGRAVDVRIIYQDDSNNYYQYWITDTTYLGYRLLKIAGGTTSSTVIDGGNWAWDTNWHTHRVTRTRAGLWELFYDGTSKGTATDTWLPSPREFRWDMETNPVPLHFDNLKIW
ncbi:MAG: hypothetical protein DSO04_01050 [Hadesarchaea archaeon]|nr:MAG: hypothetical protein DSO04_01050 [Hadesarchaea archaeon]